MVKPNIPAGEFSQNEFERKHGDGAVQRPHRYSGKAVTAIARAAIYDSALREATASDAPDKPPATVILDLVETNSAVSIEATASDTAAAITWILFFVRCPAKLRTYIDILVGMAGTPSDLLPSERWFKAPDVVVGISARLGVLPPVEKDVDKDAEVLEKWVEEQIEGDDRDTDRTVRNARSWTARQRELLDAFQRQRNFTLLFIKRGTFDRELGMNRPTEYRVVVLRYVAEVLTRARSSALWAHNRDKAIRHAAKEMFLDMPQAPPIGERKIRKRTDAELLARYTQMMRTATAQIREIYQRNTHNPDFDKQPHEVFEPLFDELREVAYRQGLASELLTPTGTNFYVPVEESPLPPDEQTGTNFCVPPVPEVCPEPKPEPEPEPANDSKSMSILTERVNINRERKRDVALRVLSFVNNLAAQHPPRTQVEREQGCPEYMPITPHLTGERTAQEMEQAIERYADGELDDEGMRRVLKRYRAAHVCIWRKGVAEWSFEN